MASNISDYFKELSPAAEMQAPSDDIYETSLSSPELLDLKKFLNSTGRASSIIANYDEWLKVGIPNQLVSSPIPVNWNGTESFLVYKKVSYIVPNYTENGETFPMYPSNSKRRKVSYLLTVIAEPTIVDDKGNDLHSGSPRVLFRIPDMVGSSFCNTSRLSSREKLQDVGQNVDDPGAYFVINGTERVIPGMDKMRLNQVFVHKGSKKFPYDNANQTFNVPSGTAIVRMIMRKLFKKTQAAAMHISVPKMKQSTTDSKEYKNLNSVNIFHFIDIVCYVYKRKDLLGKYENHVLYRRIFDFICPDDPDLKVQQHERIKDKLLATLVGYREQSFAVPLAEILEWTNVSNAPMPVRLKTVRDLIEKNIFPACNISLVEREVEEEDDTGHRIMVKEKYFEGIERMIDMVAYMASRFLLFLIGSEGYTNKNAWGNKRIDPSHIPLSQSLWTEWDRACKYFTTEISKTGSDKAPISSLDSFQNKLNTEIITKSLLSVFNTHSDEGTVGSVSQQSQQIISTNIFDLISAVTKIQSKTQKTDPSVQGRAVQSSALNIICPSENPEGGACGLVRRLAMTTSITYAVDSDNIVSLLERMFLIKEQDEINNHPIIVNELVRGWCEGKGCYEKLMLMKRNAVWEYSISFSLEEDTEDEEIIYTIEEISDGIYEDIPHEIFLTSKYPEYTDELIKHLRNITTGHFSEDERSHNYVLYLNDDIIGSCDVDYLKVVLIHSAYLGKLIPFCWDSCITYNHRGHVEVYTDQGRPVHPLYIVDDNEVAAANKAYTKDLTFNEMFDRGFVTYVDPYEEDDKTFLFSSSLKEFEEDKQKTKDIISRLQSLNDELENTEVAERKVEINNRIDYYEEDLARIEKYPMKYVGLHGVTMYGITAAASPLSNMETAAKASHAAKITKQALTGNSLPYEHKKGVSLASGGTLSLTTTSIATMVGQRRNATSISVIAAFLDMPDDQEDAIIMSRNLIDSGKVSFVMSFVVKIELEVSGIKKLLGLPKKLRHGEKYLYRNICSTGLPAIGSRLETGDACICVIERGEIDRNRTVFMKDGEMGIVKDVIITANRDSIGSAVTSYSVSVLLEDYRIPEPGDKFSIIYGQKAVIGKVENPENMVFTSDSGAILNAEIIYNSAAITGRMTLGLIAEMHMGSAAAAAGFVQDTTTFTGYDDKKFKDILLKSGYNPISTYSAISGIRGEKMYGSIYTGPINFQQLHHIASESVNAKATAKLNSVTRQVEKAKRDGGQRAGEMERANILAHRAQHIFEEKFRIYSDNYVTAWCTSCNIPSSVSSGYCRYCNSLDTFILVKMPFTYKRACDYSMTMGIRIYSVVVNEDQYVDRYIDIMKSLNTRGEIRKIDAKGKGYGGEINGEYSSHSYSEEEDELN